MGKVFLSSLNWCQIVPFHLRPLNWPERWGFLLHGMGGREHLYTTEKHFCVLVKKREIGFFFLCLLQKVLLERLKSSDSTSITLAFMQHFCSIQSFPHNQMLLKPLIRLCHHCPVENFFLCC